ncbi:hypothetical protein Y717_10355 [Streptomyces scopuliridis RB72]|uniref:Uncharacterized protein n=1 Tax=Streptomyces scopuliridis RB72 TaxID=1440053 RepID=A0A2T7SPF6_9ACTN|nr:hypothetical protein Y717_10355 [Streptomyces scopuliridis RB72]
MPRAEMTKDTHWQVHQILPLGMDLLLILGYAPAGTA